MNKHIWFVLLAILLHGCVSTGGTRIDNVPMYGQPDTVRPDFLKKADENFIKEAVAGFNGSREEASKAWAKVANDFFNEGNLDYAVRRYNQSWLLNEKNYQPYWGFGQVMIVQGNVDEAIKFYEKAKTLINDEYQKPALYTDLGLAYSFKARSFTDNLQSRNSYFELANKYFEESAELDSTYPIVWEGWANSLYHEKKFAESWEKVKKADKMGNPVHPKFRESLSKEMPEPK